MFMWLPLIMGSAMFRSYEELRTLFRRSSWWVRSSTSCPFSLELRMSPQVHNWLYGYSQHDFSQTVRGSGYRPMVLLTHGLSLALFTSAAVLAAAALHRARERIGRLRTWMPPVGLYGILVALKSRRRTRFRRRSVRRSHSLPTQADPTAGCRRPNVVAFFTYPLARSAGTVPDEEIVAFVLDFAGPDRAGSLEFRLQNERSLILRANDRLMFGWGGFCRACVFDPIFGYLLSVRDGAWIIALGDRGAVGMITRFGVLGYAILFAYRRRRSIAKRRAQFLYSTLTLVTGLYLFDCLPNGLYNYLPYLFAGAPHRLGPRHGRSHETRAARETPRSAAGNAARAQRAGARPRVTQPLHVNAVR